MRRLSDLGRYQVAKRRGRALLTASGIVLGVATLFGTMVAGASIQSGFDKLTDEIRGTADVRIAPVGAWDATLPESTVAAVRRLPDVAVASGTLWRSMRGRGSGSGSGSGSAIDIAIAGIDADAPKMSPVQVQSGRLPVAGADEVAVSAAAARRLAVNRNDTLQVDAYTGPSDLRVVGILADSGLGRANDGRVGVTSLLTAQRIDGLPGGVGGVDVGLRDGVDSEQWIAAHAPSLPGTNVRLANENGGNFEGFLSVLRSSLSLSALLALFVGAFLIYLTLSVAVVERTRMYGTLRAVGATPRQLRRVVLSEALALGVPATIAGLLVGTGLAVVLIGVLSNLVQVPRPPLSISPSAVIVGVVVGLGATAIAALVPARRASRISPVVAMKGNIEAGMRLSRSWIVGIALFALGALLARTAEGTLGSGGGSLLTLIGAVLLVPPLLRPLARVIGSVSRRLAPGVGSMAITHLVKERSRSAYTLALVMVVLAQVLVIATAGSSLTRAFDDVLDHQFAFDVEVFHDFGPLAASTKQTVLETPGVARTSELRFGRTQYLDAAVPPTVPLLVIDPTSYFDISTFAWKDGDDATAREALAAGGAVVVDEPFARAQGVRRGDDITLRTTAGPKPFRVAGIYRSFNGQVVVGLADGRIHFGAGPASALTIAATPGTTPDALKLALERRLGTGRSSTGEEVWTAAQFRKNALGQLNGFTSIFFAVVGVALIAGLLGLANTLAMSVVQRYREIGILRSVGTTPRQIVAMVLVESVTMALVAVVLAIPLGLLISGMFTASAGSSFGLSSEYTFPWTALPVIIVLALIVALGAAIAPARRAGRVQIVQALQFE